MAYITVVQHDTGLVSSREKIVKIMQEMPNADASAGRLPVMTSWLQVLVLSAGGYGHVPIPLFKQPEVDWPCCARSFAQDMPGVSLSPKARWQRRRLRN